MSLALLKIFSLNSDNSFIIQLDNSDNSYSYSLIADNPLKYYSYVVYNAHLLVINGCFPYRPM